ncbi:unnamed protein product [Penicillium olsonii]|nr:unnamed protein product [Penicillium olsonii]CAG7933162.1 unnamed protein product [Penicillium olsonii]
MARVSDLIRDSKLDTYFLPDYRVETVHRFEESDPSSGRRLVTRSEHWRPHRRIGRGGFGSVWLEKRSQGGRRSYNQDVTVRAVKQIDLDTQHGSIDYNRELEAIAKFSHARYERCFVKSFGWYECPGKLFIAMEYLENGDLFGYLHQRPPLPETEAKEITYQILEGLGMMHENGFAHRDLKPNNILVKSHPPAEWWIKLADFGLTKRIEESHAKLSTVKGTPRYFAPELWGFVERGGAYATDMWALGETTFEMLSKKPAFETPGLLAGFKSPRQFPVDILVKAGVSQPGIDFVASLMRPCPSDRPTTETAKLNVWIQSAIAPANESIASSKSEPQRSSNVEDELAKGLMSWSIKSPYKEEEPTIQDTVLGPTTQLRWRSAIQKKVGMAQEDAAPDISTLRTVKSLPKPPKSAAPESIHWYQTRPDLQRYMNAVRAVAFSPDARQLICTSRKSRMSWDLASGNIYESSRICSNLYKSKLSSSSALAYSPDNTLWACGVGLHSLHSGNVLVFDTGSEILQKELGHQGWVTSLAFSYDNEYLASAATNDEIRIWNLATLDYAWKLPSHCDHVKSVVFSPDGRLLASGSADGMVRVYDLATESLQSTFEGHLGPVNMVVFSPNGQLLASCSSDCKVKLWNLKKKALHQTLRGHGFEVTSVAFSFNSKMIASASTNGTMRVWYAARPS